MMKLYLMIINQSLIILISLSLAAGLVFTVVNIWNKQNSRKLQNVESSSAEIQQQLNIREQILDQIAQGKNPGSLNLIFAELKEVG